MESRSEEIGRQELRFNLLRAGGLVRWCGGDVGGVLLVLTIMYTTLTNYRGGNPANSNGGNNNSGANNKGGSNNGANNKGAPTRLIMGLRIIGVSGGRTAVEISLISNRTCNKGVILSTVSRRIAVGHSDSVRLAECVGRGNVSFTGLPCRAAVASVELNGSHFATINICNGSNIVTTATCGA